MITSFSPIKNRESTDAMQLTFSSARSTVASTDTICEVCLSTTLPLAAVDGYEFWRCPACSYIFVPSKLSAEDVSKVFDDRYFNDGGAGYPDYVADRQLRTEHASRYADLIACYRQPGSLLDVGGAAGYLLRTFTDRGWSGRSLEPNASMARVASELGVQADIGTLEEYESTQTFDLVTMIQVVMHFYDLRRSLAKAALLTTPGGYWLIETPNANSLTARLLGEHWHEFTPPSVQRIFTPENMHKIVANYGFTLVATGRPRKVVSGTHALSFLRYKTRHWNGAGRAAVLLIERLVPARLRLTYHAEDLFWALYQKQQ